MTEIYPQGTQAGKPESSDLDGRTVVSQAVAAAERKTKRAPPFEPTSPAKAAALAEILNQQRGVSGGTQRRRLVVAMRNLGEVTRMEAERHLGIGHAPRRLKDLEENGYHLGKRWVRQVAESGSEHITVAYSIAFDPDEAAH